MDRSGNHGGIKGRYSEWTTEALEREMQFAKRSIDLGFQTTPELLATYYEMKVELSIRDWVNGRASGKYPSVDEWSYL